MTGSEKLVFSIARRQHMVKTAERKKTERDTRWSISLRPITSYLGRSWAWAPCDRSFQSNTSEKYQAPGLGLKSQQGTKLQHHYKALLPVCSPQICKMPHGNQERIKWLTDHATLKTFKPSLIWKQTCKLKPLICLRSGQICDSINTDDWFQSILWPNQLAPVTRQTTGCQ